MKKKIILPIYPYQLLIYTISWVGSDAQTINLRVQLESRQLKLHWKLKVTVILEQMLYSNVTVIMGQREGVCITMENASMQQLFILLLH